MQGISMIVQKFALLGVSVTALMQAAPALAIPSITSGASVQINSDSAVIGTEANGPGYSYTATDSTQYAPYSYAYANASSDIHYTTRSTASVTNTGIASSNAQWFETITNATADRRRFNFTFRIDGGIVAANAISTLQNGSATAGFEALINVSRSGTAGNVFSLSRQVGLTNTSGTEVFSSTATNDLGNIIGGGTLLDDAINSGTDSISQSWADSYFTLDLGELASGESLTLSYLLRSFGNSSFLDEGCSTPGDEGYGICQSIGVRTGDPATLLSAADPAVGAKSVLAANTVPEPASLALLGFGLAGLAAARRRRRLA
jgi:hypothetical protein